ncbi:MAG: flagellar hook-basal body complex protein [Lachnospiraceae bacterium]|jgi:flagellar hook protein FlgE|nr:flagellar hook-basal body complex protein [Lachnospiraceae bacterium]
MMRSLFSGVAGLRTHQTKMDVIGNNIANVNTTGYKSQSVTFRDLMYQTTQAASGANAETGLGGINARQIGLGVTTAAINTAIAQQGSAQTTNNPFDIMISGDNFFVVSNGSENLFTRDGSFYVDGAGNLAMTSTGYTVMGWQVDPATGAPKKDTVSALKVMEDSIMTYPPDGTSEGRVTGIVDRNDKNVHTTSGRIMNFEFYDNAGYLYTARFSIHATSTNGRYYIALDDIRDSTGASVGADVLGRTNFGSTMEVETSINYTPLNGTSAASLAGDIEFTDATGATLGNQAINTGITVDAAMDDFLEKVYGIKGNSTATPPIGKIKIDAEGGLSVLEPADAKTTFYAPIAGVDSEVTNKVLTVSHADGTSVQLTPGGPYVPDDGAPAPSIADLAKYYGLNVTDEKVKEIMVNDNGSITVTKKDVDKAAYLEFDPGTGKFVSVGGSGEGLITLGLSGANGTSFKDINLNFSTCSNVNNNGSSTISSAKGDSDGLGSGRAMGEMISLSVAQDGIITAAYDNGMSRCLGQIATAAFANPSGLEKVGDNLYQATRNSGDFDGIGTDITDGGGKMQSGVLEMSNVDLSQEFTEMITTQRGFQANSRIITVSDTMLEELTNLKR